MPSWHARAKRLAIRASPRYSGCMNSNPAILFHRERARKRRERAAGSFAHHDFLHRQAAATLADSLESLTYPFPRVAEIGASGLLEPLIGIRAGTEHYLACDITPALPGTRVVADPERLPFAAESLDAIVSAGGMHWINDLPGALVQIAQALKPDGLFMATMPGPETLRELRQVFAASDTALSGGITPRIAPFPDVRDAGGLLQRAGFALPVVDRDIVTVSYADMFALIRDLRGAGEVNMLQHQLQHFTPKRFFMDAAERYAQQYSDHEGRVVASFEIVTLTAWKPATNQQQPAKRGSGKISLKDALN
jgi:NADH dehydrogenase [ubiquinone] 1 alpha subcomplex assembly factor 5